MKARSGLGSACGGKAFLSPPARGVDTLLFGVGIESSDALKEWLSDEESDGRDDMKELEPGRPAPADTGDAGLNFAVAGETRTEGKRVSWTRGRMHDTHLDEINSIDRAFPSKHAAAQLDQ